MISKAILLLFFATVVVHSYVPYDSQEDFELGDGESWIDRLKKAVEEAIAEAKQKLTELINDMYKKVQEMVEDAKATLKKKITELLDRLEELKEEAAKLGIDITDCLKDNEDELKNLPQKYGNLIVHCGDDIAARGKSLVDDAEKSVDASFQEVEDLQAKRDACVNDTIPIICRAKVDIEIAKAVVKIPGNIISIVKDAAPSIAALYPDLQKCVVQQTSDFVTEGKKIFNDIKTCVDAKRKLE